MVVHKMNQIVCGFDPSTPYRTTVSKFRRECIVEEFDDDDYECMELWSYGEDVWNGLPFFNLNDPDTAQIVPEYLKQMDFNQLERLRYEKYWRFVLGMYKVSSRMIGGSGGFGLSM